MSTESGTRSNRFNWKQWRFSLDIRTNLPTTVRDKLRSRLHLWSGGVKSWEVFKNRLVEHLLEIVYYSSSHNSSREKAAPPCLDGIALFFPAVICWNFARAEGTVSIALGLLLGKKRSSGMRKICTWDMSNLCMWWLVLHRHYPQLHVFAYRARHDRAPLKFRLSLSFLDRLDPSLTHFLRHLRAVMKFLLQASLLMFKQVWHSEVALTGTI